MASVELSTALWWPGWGVGEVSDWSSRGRGRGTESRFTTVLQAVKAGHVGGHVCAAQHVVAHDGVLGVGEGHLLHPSPRPLKQVGNTTPLSGRLLGQARGVVLLQSEQAKSTR